jgi:hypothetical protein
MPCCKNCLHAGGLHNWTVRRLWGHCLYPACPCTKYVPLTDKPKPVSSVVGRAVYKKPRR